MKLGFCLAWIHFVVCAHAISYDGTVSGIFTEVETSRFPDIQIGERFTFNYSIQVEDGATLDGQFWFWNVSIDLGSDTPFAGTHNWDDNLAAGSLYIEGGRIVDGGVGWHFESPTEGDGLIYSFAIGATAFGGGLGNGTCEWTTPTLMITGQTPPLDTPEGGSTVLLLAVALFCCWRLGREGIIPSALVVRPTAPTFPLPGYPPPSSRGTASR